MSGYLFNIHGRIFESFLASFLLTFPRTPHPEISSRFRDRRRSNPLCSGPVSELKAGQLGEHEGEGEHIAGVNVLMSDFCSVETALEGLFREAEKVALSGRLNWASSVS